jgi:hypothetical protein
MNADTTAPEYGNPYSGAVVSAFISLIRVLPPKTFNERFWNTNH